jgi:methylase of polypeptide subunit release factors
MAEQPLGAMLVPSPDRALLGLLGTLQAADYRFVTVTPATHARVNARSGNEEARNLEDVFGWRRLFASDLIPTSLFDLMQRAGAVAPEGARWRSLIRVSSFEGKLFIHSAFPTVGADSVFFGPDTYRFARAIGGGLRVRQAPVRRVVDIGCGAGPGGILIAKALPNTEVLMVDINEAALRLARVNAAFAGADRAVACRSDLFSAIDGSFDLIVSNPPYLNDPLIRAYRHGGGSLGAGLSLAILEAAVERLAPSGSLILYTGAAIVSGRDPFRTEVTARLASGGFAWSYEEVDPDVFGEELETEAYGQVDRIAAIVLTVTRGQ